MLTQFLNFLINFFKTNKFDSRVPADPKDQVVDIKLPEKKPFQVVDVKYKDAPWMLDVEADLKLNIKEFPGPADNPIYIEWFKLSGLAKKYWHDSVANCGVYVNYRMRKYFPPNKLAKNPAWAADYLKIGKKLSAFKFGCICVVKSAVSSSGYHVTFGYAQDGDYILCSGANQNDSVNVTKYHKSKVAAFIWIS